MVFKIMFSVLCLLQAFFFFISVFNRQGPKIKRFARELQWKQIVQYRFEKKPFISANKIFHSGISTHGFCFFRLHKLWYNIFIRKPSSLWQRRQWLRFNRFFEIWLFNHNHFTNCWCLCVCVCVCFSYNLLSSFALLTRWIWLQSCSSYRR